MIKPAEYAKGCRSYFFPSLSFTIFVLPTVGWPQPWEQPAWCAYRASLHHSISYSVWQASLPTPQESFLERCYHLASTENAHLIYFAGHLYRISAVKSVIGPETFRVWLFNRWGLPLSCGVASQKSHLTCRTYGNMAYQRSMKSNGRAGFPKSCRIGLHQL